MNRSTTSTIGTQTLLRGTCRRRRSEDSAENYSPPRRNGRIDRAGKVEVSRGGSQVGWVSVFETAAEWLLQIGRIFLFEDYRFEKSITRPVSINPARACSGRRACSLLFRTKRSEKILVENNPLGFPFVKRVREACALPYHEPECFRTEEI